MSRYVSDKQIPTTRNLFIFRDFSAEMEYGIGSERRKENDKKSEESNEK